MELDEQVIGTTGKAYTFTVGKSHVEQFAEAIGDDNPLYRDEAYARQHGFKQCVVPPTFAMAIGSAGGDFPIELDTRRMLHGEQEFIYYRPIQIGDQLHCQMKVTDLYEKQGRSGLMQFLVLDTEMKDDAGDMVAVSRTNIIYRPLTHV